MPFADHVRAVALRLELLGNRDLIRMESEKPMCRPVRIDAHIHSATLRIRAGQEGRSRGRANRRSSTEVCESSAFSSELVDVGRLADLVAVAAEDAGLEVVGDDEEDVRLGLLRAGRRDRQQ